MEKKAQMYSYALGCPNIEEKNWCTFRALKVTGGEKNALALSIYSTCLDDICVYNQPYDPTPMYESLLQDEDTCPTAWQMNYCYNTSDFMTGMQWDLYQLCLEN